MPLRRIRVAALRNITSAELLLAPRTSYVYGPNGAGKTTLLEGIYLLGRGRSFRTRQTRRLIQHGQPGFAVFGELDRVGGIVRMGVGFAEGRLDKKIDGELVPGTAALAEQLAVHVIDPGVHALIEGGPSERRRFLDWGVFHVEPNYLPAWREYRRALGQRNAALKHGATAVELSSWTERLVVTGDAVDGLRRSYMERLRAVAARHGEALLEHELSVDYQRGWPADRTFGEALAATETRDREHGLTGAGPHRADLVVRVGGRRAQDEASRGQQKLCAAALVLAQAEVDATQRGERTVLLLDDPAAELDGGRLGALLEASAGIPVQRVLTALSPSQLPPNTESAVFHVERGSVKEV